MSTMELTRIAEIEFETKTWYKHDINTQIPFVAHQPAGVRVDNGDTYTHWMSTHTTYILTHDGVGWHVTSDEWTDDHVCRLADASGPRGSFVAALPTHGGGSVQLEPGAIYQLLFAASDDNTRTVLALSRVS